MIDDEVHQEVGAEGRVAECFGDEDERGEVFDTQEMLHRRFVEDGLAFG